MNTDTVKGVLRRQWNKFNVKADVFKLLDVMDQTGVRVNGRFGTADKMWKIVNEKIVKDVLWQHFVETFPCPCDFIDAKTKFIESMSIWSMAGYVIGLGDRH